MENNEANGLFAEAVKTAPGPIQALWPRYFQGLVHSNNFEKKSKNRIKQEKWKIISF